MSVPSLSLLRCSPNVFLVADSFEVIQPDTASVQTGLSAFTHQVRVVTGVIDDHAGGDRSIGLPVNNAVGVFLVPLSISGRQKDSLPIATALPLQWNVLPKALVRRYRWRHGLEPRQVASRVRSLLSPVVNATQISRLNRSSTDSANTADLIDARRTAQTRCAIVPTTPSSRADRLIAASHRTGRHHSIFYAA